MPSFPRPLNNEEMSPEDNDNNNHDLNLDEAIQETIMSAEGRDVAEKEIRHSFEGILRVSPNDNEYASDGGLGIGRFDGDEIKTVAGRQYVSDSTGQLTTLELYTEAARIGNTHLKGKTVVGSQKMNNQTAGNDSLTVNAPATFNNDLTV